MKADGKWRAVPCQLNGRELYKLSKELDVGPRVSQSLLVAGPRRPRPSEKLALANTLCAQLNSMRTVNTLCRPLRYQMINSSHFLQYSHCSRPRLPHQTLHFERVKRVTRVKTRSSEVIAVLRDDEVCQPWTLTASPRYLLLDLPSALRLVLRRLKVSQHHHTSFACLHGIVTDESAIS